MTSVLIRQSVVREGGRKAYHDLEVDEPEITVGSGAANIIRFSGHGVASEHALLLVDAGDAKLRAMGGQRVTLNEKPVRRARLREGDRLTFGANSIDILPTPPGFDLALAVDAAGESEAYQLQDTYRTDLKGTWLKKRRPAWIFAVLVVTFFFGVPFGLSRFSPIQDIDYPSLLTDDIWTTGDLHPGHQLNAERCSDCHIELFSQVPDLACLECHGEVRDHLDPDQLTAHGLEKDRCGACHRDHNEPPMLVDSSTKACTVCHADENGFERPGDPIAAVQAFAPGKHPEFEVTLRRATDALDGAGWPDRVIPVGIAREESNLEFPHAVHLDGESVTDLRSGESLACSACHMLGIDGEHFAPVEMETHCENCHELGFDASDPFRRLPHGDVREAILTMENHFIARAYQPQPQGTEARRRQIPDRDERDNRCRLSRSDCARIALEAGLEEHFLRTGCATCHEVAIRESTNVADRYDIEPVTLVDDFMPAARFDHESHLIQGDAVGDAACESCHAATRSDSSSDLMMPGIETCLECHSTETNVTEVRLSCVNCHAYHPSARMIGPDSTR